MFAVFAMGRPESRERDSSTRNQKPSRTGIDLSLAPAALGDTPHVVLSLRSDFLLASLGRLRLFNSRHISHPPDNHPPPSLPPSSPSPHLSPSLPPAVPPTALQSPSSLNQLRIQLPDVVRS